MKLSPEEQKIQEILKSGRIVSGGFLGSDTRNYIQIIEDDEAELAKLGWTKELLADKMMYVTEIAGKGLGTWVKITEELEAKVDEAKGELTIEFLEAAVPIPITIPIESARLIESAEKSEKK